MTLRVPAVLSPKEKRYGGDMQFHPSGVSKEGTHRPDRLVRRAQELHNHVYLLDLGTPRQQGLVGQQLGQDAAHGPTGNTWPQHRGAQPTQAWLCPKPPTGLQGKAWDAIF